MTTGDAREAGSSAIADRAPAGPPLGTRRAHIFISYKRNFDPDETVARQVFEKLREQHDIFIDRTMRVGTDWPARIDAELRQADYLIVFLSEKSVASEMVEGEVETAHRLAKEQGGRPKILPVRLAYDGPLPYPLSAYLHRIQWADWKSMQDTPDLIDTLLQVVSGGELKKTGDQEARSNKGKEQPELPPPPSASIEMPGGPIDLQSPCYVVRPCDRLALDAIKRPGGVTLTIKGPRQVGKTSLLVRTCDAALKANKRVVFLDFQLFDHNALTNADLFFCQFCELITDELDLKSRRDEFWDMPLGNSYRCTRYMSRYVLRELDTSLVLAMDEVEKIFDADFRSDFFSMLRSWHSSRANTPIWKRLDLALVTSTEPYQLIENPNMSPFNVGEVIEPADFTAEQVHELNDRHGSALNPEEERQLMTLLHGHPFLVRRALYLVANRDISAADLFANATEDRGPFGDHLRHHLFRIYDKPELRAGFLEVIRDKRCRDERVFYRLQGAGLVRREEGKEVPRCQLYADYFREHLDG